MNIQSKTHVAEVSKGWLNVLKLAPAMVTKTVIENGTTTSVETMSATTCFPGLSDRDARNVFIAWPAQDNKSFNVDVNCGAQRWCGNQSVKQVEKALQRCGFKPKQRATIFETIA